MSEKRYVAYIGTHTQDASGGIHILDLDMDGCSFTERKVVSASNPTDVLVANNGNYLYSTSDQGVNAYRILPDGDLEFLNSQWTGGMRGSYLETDPEDHFLFVAGYYDGRISVMHLNGDGTVGEIADGVFHQGMGVDETGRNYMPHVTCVKLAPYRKGIFAVDNGLDQVKVYDFDSQTGKLTFRGVVRCEINARPRLLRVDYEKELIYVLGEGSNRVCVYQPPEIKPADGSREILEPVQKISTLGDDQRKNAASFGMDFTPDGNHLFVSNSVTNTVMVYDVDPETGLLSVNCSGSLSGEYPKAIAALPDNEHFVALGMNTGTVTTYRVNYEEHYFLMSARPLLIKQPNSIYIYDLRGQKS